MRAYPHTHTHSNEQKTKHLNNVECLMYYMYCGAQKYASWFCKLGSCVMQNVFIVCGWIAVANSKQERTVASAALPVLAASSGSGNITITTCKSIHFIWKIMRTWELNSINLLFLFRIQISTTTTALSHIYQLNAMNLFTFFVHFSCSHAFSFFADCCCCWFTFHFCTRRKSVEKKNGNTIRKPQKPINQWNHNGAITILISPWFWNT